MTPENPPSSTLEIGEVIKLNWPMTIPKHATFTINSTQPLKILRPHPMQIHALTPIHILSDCRLDIVPAGPPTPGFAAGWLKLPAELKLAILRHNLIYGGPIWPSNVNNVIRRDLLPYLHMTPDIAELASTVFYGANVFVMQFSSSSPRSASKLAIPPSPIRHLLRSVKLLTRLTTLDWRMLKSMAGLQQHGFTKLLHLEVRCLAWEVAEHLRLPKGTPDRYESETLKERLQSEWVEPVRMPFGGVVVFDRSGLRRLGTSEVDSANSTWLQHVEDFVKRSILFREG
ncbi:hypothetical protein EJ02DRAFT_469392 [Clathrospora elynae]|uniref:Uncharacterized protein n=1 Tax=Clathrospora elynae TaxID=706981 RepID=A0A6A5SH39_9PLEO|nr:hypothetical protein EJ02DRAFT_469392 [Clathrospora elynae]